MERIKPGLFYGLSTTEIPNAVSTRKQHDTLGKVMQINQNLWIYFGSIILLLGIVGNSLSLCVLCRRRMRKLVVGTYLITLTTSDLVASFTAVLRMWVYFLFHLDYFAKSAHLCKPLIFLQNFSKLCSSWMVVTITVERTFLICRPLTSVVQRPCFLNPGAIIISVCLVLTLVVSPEMYFVEIEAHICTYFYGHPHWKILEALHYTFYSFLPSLIIIPCSLIIVHKLRNNQWSYLARREQTLRATALPTVAIVSMWVPPSFHARMSSSSSSTSTSSLSPGDPSAPSSPLPLLNPLFENVTSARRSSPLLPNLRHSDSRAHLSRHRLCRLRQNIRIVLIINVVFLVTTTPLCVLRFILLFADTIDQSSKHVMFYASQIASLFCDMNLFIDLILFIASGKAFRDELKTLEPRRFRRRRPIHSNIIVCTLNSDT